MITSLETVFDQVVRGNSEVFTSPNYDETLGAPYDTTVEVEVEDTGGTSPPTGITVKWYHSNTGKAYISLATLVNNESVASLPYRQIINQTGPYGKHGRLGVTLIGGTAPTARVRIWTLGRMRS